MKSSKTYCGETLVNLKELIETDVKRLIKLEYYETKEVIHDNFTKYGIEVIKKEYMNKQFIKEKSNVDCITEDKAEIEEIISILKRNKVTPIGLVETINDLVRKRIAD